MHSFTAMSAGSFLAHMPAEKAASFQQKENNQKKGQVFLQNQRSLHLDSSRLDESTCFSEKGLDALFNVRFPEKWCHAQAWFTLDCKTEVIHVHIKRH